MLVRAVNSLNAFLDIDVISPVKLTVFIVSLELVNTPDGLL